ncbi:ABC transporter permease [Microbacterium sp.]|uniref:ABC transporter permease n=1 Tax=Microbacterium sp. TaxID=51671 RepID=UPI0039E5C5BF
MHIPLIIARRIASMLVVLLLIVVVSFFVTRVLPGDPATTLAGIGTSPDQIAVVRRNLGLDKPLWEQFGHYLQSVAALDFGSSLRSKQPISAEIGARLPATMELALYATLASSAGAVLLAILAVGARGTWTDTAVRIGSVVGSSAPVFWLALLLQLVFYGWLQVLPSGGRLPFSQSAPPTLTGFYTVDALLAGDVATFGTAVVHLILPVASLTIASLGALTRLLRAQLRDELRSDYVATARTRGSGRFRLLARHALPNAASPAITVVGMEFAFLVAGAIFVERIYQWPGLGSYTWDAIVGLDYPVVSAVAVTLGGVFVLTSLFVDIAYRLIDPRIRLS